MSRTGARLCSWLITLGLLAGLVLAARRLPGCGGPIGELRWLLVRSPPSPAAYRRAADILRAAEERAPGARAGLLSQLLQEPADQTVRAGLTLLADQLQQLPESAAERQALCQAFDEWFARRSTAEKIAYLPQSLVCATESASERFVAGAPLVAIAPLLPQWPEFPAGERERWLLAASLTRDEQTRQLAFFLLFSPEPPAPLRVAQRLHVLDGLVSQKHPDPLTPDAPLVRLSAEQLRAELRVPPERLAELLADPLPAVRQAAGRILALAGDARGLPALDEWRRTRSGLPPEARALLADLYGEDWEDALESRSATRAASTSDGE